MVFLCNKINSIHMLHECQNGGGGGGGGGIFPILVCAGGWDKGRKISEGWGWNIIGVFCVPGQYRCTSHLQALNRCRPGAGTALLEFRPVRTPLDGQGGHAKCISYSAGHPDDRSLLGMMWEGVLYVDTALPFGHRSDPKIFNVVADAMEWVAKSRGLSNLLHYLDDFPHCGRSHSMECAENLTILLAMFRDLGIPVAMEKLDGPATCLAFLGIEV